MEALIEGILKYSRAGRLRDKLEMISINALLAESTELLNPPPNACIIIGPEMPTIETERAALRVQAQLIEDLLDVARIISGKMRLKADSLEPAAVCENALESV